jgi:hypothetical protein
MADTKPPAPPPTPASLPTGSTPGKPPTGAPSTGQVDRSPTEKAAEAGEKKSKQDDKALQDHQPSGKVADKDYKRKFVDPRARYEGADDSKPEKDEFDGEQGGKENKIRDVRSVETQQKKDFEHLQSQMLGTEDGGQFSQPINPPVDAEEGEPTGTAAEKNEVTRAKDGK